MVTGVEPQHLQRCIYWPFLSLRQRTTISEHDTMIITVDGVESGPAVRAVTESTLVVSYQVLPFVSGMRPEEWLLAPRGGCP